MTRYRRHTGPIALTAAALMIVAACCVDEPSPGPEGDQDRARPARRQRGSGRRLLRRPDLRGAGELPALRRRHQPLSRLRRGVGHRQAGGGARQHRRRRDEAGGPGRHREGRQGRHGRQVPRPVPGGLVPGRRRHLDQHERQRSARQRRARADGAQEGRVQHHRAARRPEHVAVDQRLLPDGDQGRAPPAQRQADRRAREAVGVVPRQGQRST